MYGPPGASRLGPLVPVIRAFSFPFMSSLCHLYVFALPLSALSAPPFPHGSVRTPARPWANTVC